MSSSDDRRRPRVAGQRRRHGRPSGDVPAPATTPAPEPEVVEPEVLEPGEPQPIDPVEPDEGGGEGAGRRGRLPAGAAAPLTLLVVALVALALVLTVSLRDPGARERDARAATAAARTSLEQLLSYSWKTLDAQAQRNAGLLTGSFRTEYATTMAGAIAPVAEKQKVTVQARSYEAGVMGQTPDTVTVQVFLNQAKTAEGEEQPSVDQNRVIATMRKVDGRWLVERLSAY
ncbi:hypothetical protein KMZ32_17595 [Phycicoccus sp. MAQZ13P-2]|uniref:hypothetical protein n=1 Tax=Phycicoccus mangrovi TaxID=2840470 RepID=UPI001C008518|nr:hypothetical protein [Phycicoccus mangrovi]MBT9256356.1 hypothetical protein [Phycicoccus mangrovi]MBT9275894.1 hypothetical protein [Phycicoccus mangrovi]